MAEWDCVLLWGEDGAFEVMGGGEEKVVDFGRPGTPPDAEGDPALAKRLRRWATVWGLDTMSRRHLAGQDAAGKLSR